MKSKERKFIVVDEDNRPMSFHSGSGQLCYTYTLGHSRWYLQAYTREQAENAIKVTKEFRKKRGFSIDSYYLMPINV